MKKIGAMIMLLVASMAAPGAVAQHEHHQQATPQAGASAEPMGSQGGSHMGLMEHSGMMPGMRASGGMAMCQQMMSAKAGCPMQEIKALAGKLTASLAEIQKAQDPATLQSKLAEHGMLLDQLQEEAQRQCPMMGAMDHPPTADQANPHH
jgi:hypothetical protein